MTTVISRRALRPALLGLAITAILTCLAGCGGGSGSLLAGGGTGINQGGGTTRAALSGQVNAPASQTRAAKLLGRDANTLVPVGGATVTLLDLSATDPTKPVDTTKTDLNGNYAFTNVTAGDNYQVVATKSVSTGTLTLSAIVTPPTGSTPTPVTRNLDPVTTVAAVAVQAQLVDLKKTDPNAGKGDLQALSQELEKKQDPNAPPPDLTNPTAITTAATTLQTAAAPVGSYFGSAVGDSNGATKLAALIDKNGKFFIAALPDPSQMSSNNGGNNGNGTSNGGNNSSPTGGNNGNGGGNSTGPGSNGNGTGNGGNATGGNNTGNGNGNGNDKGSNFAVGSVDASGVVNAKTTDGRITIQGVFTGGVGVGTWQQTDGKKGTWSLNLLTNQWSGLYAGKYTNPDKTRGDFAVVILDDHSVIITGANNTDGSVYGTGTVDAGGKVTFTVQSNGGAVSGTGQIDATTGTISGSFTSSDGAGTFIGSRKTADTSDL